MQVVSEGQITYQELSAAEPQEIGKTQAASRVEYVNVIRVYAMSIVVLIHVAAILAPHINTIAPSDWWISNMLHGFSKGGPPIFTLVSGMLLLSGKDQPIQTFLRKRFLKVLVPFIGWAGIYLMWRAYNGEEFTVLKVVDSIFNGPPYYHLWFIQMILGLYLATPVLRVFVRNSSPSLIRYFIGIWVLAVAIIPILQRFFDVHIGVQFVVMTGFSGYYILGYYLRDVMLAPKQMLPTLLIVVTSILFTEVTTYALTMENAGQLDSFFLNNQGINIIIIAVGMFLFLKSLPWGQIFEWHPAIKRLIDTLSTCSLGVYFVHVLIMEILGSGMLGIKLGPLTGGALVGIPLTWIVTLSTSIIVILIIKRIPILNLIVP